MRVLGSTLGVALVLIASGCGGSSGGGTWAVVARGAFGSGQTPFLHTTVGRPSQLEVTVTASPNVQATTHYSINCGNEESTWHREGPRGTTPLTGRIAVPPGPPGSCFLALSATRATPAKLTVEVLTRAAAGAT